MKNILYTIILSFLFSSSVALELNSFVAECVEGETHRYDNGHGWSTEKWGGIKIVWDGGEHMEVDGKPYMVVHSSNSALYAIRLYEFGIFSIIIDIRLGEAVLAQVASGIDIGGDRPIKVRSQNLKCTLR